MTSTTVWMPASTRVCATSSAIISVIDATSTLWRESAVMNSTAAQPANAIAAWPLGQAAPHGSPAAGRRLDGDHDQHHQHQRDHGQVHRRLAHPGQRRRGRRRAAGRRTPCSRRRRRRTRRPAPRRRPRPSRPWPAGRSWSSRRRWPPRSPCSAAPPRSPVRPRSSARAARPGVTPTARPAISASAGRREVDPHVALRAEGVDDALERVVERRDDRAARLRAPLPGRRCRRRRRLCHLGHATSPRPAVSVSCSASIAPSSVSWS